MLNAGIIGLGRMGAEPSSRLAGKVPNGWLPISHLEAIMLNKAVTISAICDLRTERMDWVKSYYKIEAATYSDPFELVKDNIDIISIATRTQERYDIILKAIDHSVKAIVAEKPLANNIKRTTEIIKKVSESNCILGYGAARRAMGIYRQAKDIVESGLVGTLESIVAEFGYSKLLWSLPHAIDLFIYFADSIDVDFISGHCSIECDKLYKEYYDGDPLVQTATIKFTNGIIANIVPSNGLNIRLGCSKGIVTIHGDGDYIEINQVDKYDSYFTSSRKIGNGYTTSGISNIYTSITNSLLDKTPFNIIKPEEIEMNQKILFGILQSSVQNGERVSIESLSEDFLITGRSGDLFA